MSETITVRAVVQVSRRIVTSQTTSVDVEVDLPAGTDHYWIEDAIEREALEVAYGLTTSWDESFTEDPDQYEIDNVVIEE